MGFYRREWCGELDETQVNAVVTVAGWVKRIRKLGALTFVDLSDRSGLVQAFVTEGHGAFEQVSSLTRESVVQITGKLLKRKEPNASLKTGQVEIEISKVHVFSKAKTPPLIVEDKTDALEDARLQYRYLDLRRPIMQQHMVFRSRFTNALRYRLLQKHFVEIETPNLTKSTPFGAKDYLVPTRISDNAFYALPQSPQIYKQLLMVAGMERYFQIARCFRDEDMRSDRQPEFTQLDIELSFCTPAEIQAVVEDILVAAFADVGFNLPKQFTRLTFEQAMEQYGSDKPDLRFGTQLRDVTSVFKDSQVKFLATAPCVKAIVHPGRITKKQVGELEKTAKDNGAGGLAWIYMKNNELIEGSIAKIVEKNKIEGLVKQDAGCSATMEGTLLFVAGTREACNKALGAVRNHMRDMLYLALPNMLAIAWITDWPLFEKDEATQTYQAAHHPFTSPTQDTLGTFDTDRDHAKAEAYDIVLNGYEIGGGSFRISDQEVQRRMFAAIGLEEAQIQANFGFMLDAFSYGVPPHGGIAFGLDRIIMILRETASIRDVIAFPKNSTGHDVMMGAPTKIATSRLEELGLKRNK